MRNTPSPAAADKTIASACSTWCSSRTTTSPRCATSSPTPSPPPSRRAREKFPQLKVEVEADTLEQVEQAAAAGADIILLDNMNPAQLRLAVQKCRRPRKTEASGGVNLATVRAIAETGVDFISVGALTHSARAVDIGLDFESE